MAQIDKDFLLLQMELEKALNAGMHETAQAIKSIIESRYGRLTASEMDTALSGISELLVAFVATMASQTRDTQAAIAAMKAEKGKEPYLGLLKRAGAPVGTQTRFIQQLNGYGDRVYKAFYDRAAFRDGVSYQYRILTVLMSAEQTVRNISRNGARDGLSARQIAQKIEGFLDPQYRGRRPKPLTEARKAMRADKSYKPKRIRSGSLPYQAIRIARTESAETFRASTSQMYEQTIFAGGDYDWVLSNSHPFTDHCNRLAAASPYKADERPDTHPNCLCAWVKRPPSLADVERLLKERGVVE